MIRDKIGDQAANSIESLRDEVLKLRQAIETHRKQKADDRCIEDDDRLYEVLQDGIKCDRRVGSKEAMLHNCQRFIENRCEGGGWPTYAELELQLKVITQKSLTSDDNIVYLRQELEGLHQRCLFLETELRRYKGKLQ